MSWTKLDDLWTERPDITALDFDTRWHYLCLIQRCSRGDVRDGWLRTVDANRASDVPDPAACGRALIGAGLLEYDAGTARVRVIEVDEHLPNDATRKRSEQSKLRMRRSRAHRAGDHSLCIPKTCESATVAQDVARNVGTGRVNPSLDGFRDGVARNATTLPPTASGAPASAPQLRIVGDDA